MKRRVMRMEEEEEETEEKKEEDEKSFLFLASVVYLVFLGCAVLGGRVAVGVFGVLGVWNWLSLVYLVGMMYLVDGRMVYFVPLAYLLHFSSFVSRAFGGLKVLGVFDGSSVFGGCDVLRILWLGCIWCA